MYWPNSPDVIIRIILDAPFGGQCHCSLFSEVRILGDAAFTCKPIAHQNGERGTVVACDVRARGQYTHAYNSIVGFVFTGSTYLQSIQV